MAFELTQTRLPRGVHRTRVSEMRLSGSRALVRRSRTAPRGRTVERVLTARPTPL